MDPPHGEKFMLWVDAVGGFLVCLAEEVTIGQAVPSVAVDVPVLADISSRHARIRRSGEGYLIDAIRDVRLDGRPAATVGSLGDGSRIELGEGVRLLFRRPHALSATARLEFDSPHRTQPAADAVLLMAQSCVLGPSSDSHVVCRDWPHEVVLYRHDEQLYCRTAGRFEVDGRRCRDRRPITRNSRIAGDWFTMKLEEM